MKSVLEHPSVQRVRTALAAAGLSPKITVFDEPTPTAATAAAALGCKVGQIANSLIFRTEDDQPVLVMGSGGKRVDLERVAAALAERTGGRAILRADAAFVREATGFAIGGVAPVGHRRPPLTAIDGALKAHPILWAAAGHVHTVFPLSFDELKTLTGGVVARL